MAWLMWIGGAVVCLVGYQIVAWYNTRRISALNAIHAALTCRTLDQQQMGAVDGRVAFIFQRLGIDISLLGNSFPPNSGSSGPRKPAVVYAFRSLAMHELGIPSMDSELPRWYVLKNPFHAEFATKEIEKYRGKYERKHNISLVELNSQ